MTSERLSHIRGSCNSMVAANAHSLQNCYCFYSQTGLSGWLSTFLYDVCTFFLGLVTSVAQLAEGSFFWWGSLLQSFFRSFPKTVCLLVSLPLLRPVRLTNVWSLLFSTRTLFCGRFSSQVDHWPQLRTLAHFWALYLALGLGNSRVFQELTQNTSCLLQLTLTQLS